MCNGMVRIYNLDVSCDIYAAVTKQHMKVYMHLEM